MNFLRGVSVGRAEEMGKAMGRTTENSLLDSEILKQNLVLQGLTKATGKELLTEGSEKCAEDPRINAEGCDGGGATVPTGNFITSKPI